MLEIIINGSTPNNSTPQTTQSQEVKLFRQDLTMTLTFSLSTMQDISANIMLGKEQVGSKQMDSESQMEIAGQKITS